MPTEKEPQLNREEARPESEEKLEVKGENRNYEEAVKINDLIEKKLITRTTASFLKNEASADDLEYEAREGIKGYEFEEEATKRAYEKIIDLRQDHMYFLHSTVDPLNALPSIFQHGIEAFVTPATPNGRSLHRIRTYTDYQAYNQACLSDIWREVRIYESVFNNERAYDGFVLSLRGIETNYVMEMSDRYKLGLDRNKLQNDFLTRLTYLRELGAQGFPSTDEINYLKQVFSKAPQELTYDYLSKKIPDRLCKWAVFVPRDIYISPDSEEGKLILSKRPIVNLEEELGGYRRGETDNLTLIVKFENSEEQKHFFPIQLFSEFGFPDGTIGDLQPHHIQGAVIVEPSVSIGKIHHDIFLNLCKSFTIPVYDKGLNTIWPKQMSYEEVKEFIVEREKRKEREESI